MEQTKSSSSRPPGRRGKLKVIYLFDWVDRANQSKAVHFIDQVDKANLTSFHLRVSLAVYKINRSVNLVDGPILSELIDILFAVISH